jgi:hypothetical protein
MAMTQQWDRVNERYRELKGIVQLATIVTRMQQLVAALREDPALHDVEPSVSLAALNLSPSHSERHVAVIWSEDQPQGYKVSMVDPSLTYSEATKVDEAQVVATLVQYLARVRSSSHR